ncbi:MAG: biopolymer transporter ExbD [Marinobacter sp.]|uniref:ExbD/TolR family protein n=1 Tax=Marinobacter sp. TaxID=50741 RepID=UPI0034A00ADB
MELLVPPPPGSGKSLMERVEDSLLPLINLVFLLLMFFMVAGQMAATPLPELPNVSEPRSPQSPEADLLVKSGTDWSVEGQSVNADTLLSTLSEPEANRELRIAADRTVTMSDLERLFRLLEDGGYENVILLTEPRQ